MQVGVVRNLFIKSYSDQLKVMTGTMNAEVMGIVKASKSVVQWESMDNTSV